MAHESAIIYIGGDGPDHSLAHPHLDGALVIAADSGWEHAIAAGAQPSLLVGDMDSIRADHLADARARGTIIVEHPRDKDLTDLEIALDAARDAGARRVHVVSGGGDRFDHLLAMVHSLAARADDATVTAQIGGSRIHILTPRLHVTFPASPGDTVSLVPLGGRAKGVSTRGLRWELRRDTLRPFESRGVSNVATHDEVRVSVRTGVVAIIRPDHREDHP